LTNAFAKHIFFGFLKQIVYVRKPFVSESCDKDSPLQTSKTMLDNEDIIHTVGRLAEKEVSFYLVFIRITNKVYIRSTYPRFTYDKILEAYYNRLMSIEGESIHIDQYDEETLTIISKKASRHKFTFLSLLDGAAKGLKVGDHQVSLENKYGMTESPRDGRRPQRLMQNAESAMNTVVGNHYKYKVFTEEFSKRNIRKFNIQSNLHEAITQKQFHVVFQPQISLEDKRITGFEVLLRWDSPILGTVAPNEFIPIAEQYGYIDALTNQVLDDILLVIPYLEGELDVFRIAINISPILFEDQGWLQRFVKRIRDKNIAHDRIEIEVTESFLIGDFKQSIRAIDYLHRKGFTIAIDDFGSGFSSLRYLKTLPIDKLKIDKSFIYSLSRNDRNICRSIIDLGHNIGATVLG